MRRMTLALLLAVVALPFLASPCWACKCASGPPRAQARSVDTIFTGTVIATSSRAGMTIARLVVEESFKGRGAHEITVRTPRFTTACGVALREDARYTVFGNTRGSHVETTSCTGTVRGPIQPARIGLEPQRALRPDQVGPQASDEQAAQSRSTSGSRPSWGVLGAGAVVGAAALWLWRRRSISTRRARGAPPASPKAPAG
jgi:hypothetical protein